jgi:fatty-acid desaturase
MPLLTTAAPQSLPLPNLVDLRVIQRTYVAAFVILHGLALLALAPWFFSWSGVIAFWIGVVIFGQLGIPVCYHRQLAHRSFKTPKWLERCFVVLALCSAQDTPAKWVAWHRKHHGHSDEREDPHTPLVNFYWSHIGWLCVKNRSLATMAFYQKYARDILEDPFYMYLERHWLSIAWIYLSHAAIYFLVAWAGAFAALGEAGASLQLALSLLVWGVFARSVYVWHITWSVNSLTHIFGYRNFDTDDNSRNNWFVALLTGGEGWHNNHHADQAAASVQTRWWEFDLNYYIIKGLERVGLATQVVPLKGRRRAASASGAVPPPHWKEAVVDGHSVQAESGQKAGIAISADIS